MNNSFENFFNFMTLLVAGATSSRICLRTRVLFVSSTRFLKPPEAVGRLTAAMAGKADAYDKVMKPNKLLWEIYKADGETALRGILDALEELKDIDPNGSSDD